MFLDMLNSKKILEKTLVHKALLMFVAFSLYVLSGVFSKLASQHPFLSLSYIGYFSCVFFALGLYAILWQRILSFMQLNKAFLCKSITIVMLLIISRYCFNENVSFNNIIGASFIISGLIVLAWRK